jgi:hypothetical protein
LLINEHKALGREPRQYVYLPLLNPVEGNTVWQSYLQVKKDIAMLVQSKLERMMNTPGLEDLLAQM